MPIKGVAPLKPRGRKLWHHKNLTITLEKYYKKKYQHEQEEFPDFHDAQLKKIFTALLMRNGGPLRKIVGKIKR